MAILPTERHCKKLDPKLRRIAQTFEEPLKLRRDLEANVVLHQDFAPNSDDGFPDIEVAPEGAYKRCLVRHRGIPEEFEALDWHSIVDGISTVSIPLHQLNQLAQSPSIDFVEAGRNFSPMLVSSLTETRADAVHRGEISGVGLTGAGVVVGIIDSPLDFTLADFRNDDGSTRIAFIWDQGLNPSVNEKSPTDFAYGVEYDSADIDGSNNGTAMVRHTFGVASHGTHVAGIAVGNGRSGDATFPAGDYVGVAPEALIIYVNPNSSDQNSSFTDSTNVADAISYIYGKAEEMGLPCVINMSLGQNGGSHDGESIVERAIDRLLETPGRSFVSAAGNEHIWRGHTSGSFNAGETTTLRWKAGGGIPWPFNGGNPLPDSEFGDFTPNELEVWFSSRDTVRVRVVSPGGLASDWITTNESESTDLANGNSVFLDVERFSILNGDSRIYVEIEPVTELVEEGVWLVEIEGLNVRDGHYDGFIERDVRMHRVPLNNGAEVLN